MERTVENTDEHFWLLKEQLTNNFDKSCLNVRLCEETIVEEGVESEVNEMKVQI